MYWWLRIPPRTTPIGITLYIVPSHLGDLGEAYRDATAMPPPRFPISNHLRGGISTGLECTDVYYMEKARFMSPNSTSFFRDMCQRSSGRGQVMFIPWGLPSFSLPVSQTSNTIIFGDHRVKLSSECIGMALVPKLLWCNEPILKMIITVNGM